MKYSMYEFHLLKKVGDSIEIFGVGTNIRACATRYGATNGIKIAVNVIKPERIKYKCTRIE